MPLWFQASLVASAALGSSVYQTIMQERLPNAAHVLSRDSRGDARLYERFPPHSKREVPHPEDDKKHRYSKDQTLQDCQHRGKHQETPGDFHDFHGKQEIDRQPPEVPYAKESDKTDYEKGQDVCTEPLWQLTK